MSSSSKISPAIEVDENENSSLSSNKRSEAYQYFTFKTQRWYCNYCSKNFGDKSTSTLWRHIAKHPKIVEARRVQKEQKQRKVGEMDKYTVTAEKENAKFKDMISFIRPGIYIPCANTLRRDLTENFKNAKERFRQELQETPGRLSFTVDAWTSKNQIPFLGISVHWINENWELKCTTLDFCILSGPHTGINLSSKFLESLEDFGIATKILAVACDNASNMDVMLDKISQSLAKKSITFDPKNQRVRCFAHVINLAAKKLIDNLQVPLLYEDENSFEEAEDTEDNLKDTIYKLRKVIVKIRASSQRREKFKQQCIAANMVPLELIPDVSTRWNSTEIMLERALTLKQPLHNTASADKDLKKYILLEEEWERILEIRGILQHYKKCTDLSVSQQYPTLSYTIPMYNFLLDKLEDEYDKRKESDKEEDEEEDDDDSDDDNESENDEILCALKQSIEKIKKYYTFTSGLIYTAATVLDPRIKLQYYKDNMWEESFIQEARKQVTNLWKTTYKPNISENVEPSDNADDELFGHIFKKRKIEEKDELSIYLNEGVAPGKTDILMWWKLHEIEYPNLSKMARDYLSIPATSAPMERIFSGGTDLVVQK
ncbi:ribonuclease H-like protein [Rhizophagus irregularis DAOM 181602=DAOM 197198]|nr:ribonuclease H-like protein [Rhizophagus irregularis DAOM 181602=DAOM 197198]